MRAAYLAALLFFSSFAAHAAGFDCARAQSPREKAVCASPKLSALDSQLTSVYTAELREISPAAAAEVQADQRQWLGFLDAVCAKAKAEDMPGCLAERYGTRIDQLTPGKGLLKHGGSLFFTRGYFLALPESAKDVSEQQGYGASVHAMDYGEFAWPEIDQPTPDQGKWNAAVKQQAKTIETAHPKLAPQYEKGGFADVVRGGSAFGYWSLSGANDRLIGVKIGISTYGWGGAHPITGFSIFNWWLHEVRQVTPSDVFRADGDWKKQLAPLVLAALRKDPGADSLWKGNELTDAIAGELDKPTAWDITQADLTINYGEYEVGPYAVGMPSATIPWRTIMPLLNPSLLPETLPAAIASPER